MAAYLILDIDIRDPQKYEIYKREVPRLVSKHGGEYLVRGGAHEVLEGDWHPTRLVLFRFPDRQAIRNLFNDPEYQPLKLVRHESGTSDLVAMDGVA
jgi:uncharacterized protein (DUF1330 family)